MTVLVGMYNDDRTDVALISDRRAVPNEIGEANGVQLVEDTIKTFKLNDACSIGFAGSVPLENALLSRILYIPMPPQDESLLVRLAGSEGRWPLLTFDTVIEQIRRVMPEIIARQKPPPGVWLGILAAGMMRDEIPMLAGFNGMRDWEPEPCFSGYAYMAPFNRNTDKRARKEFESVISAPGAPFDDRLKAAVAYCAPRYYSVNSGYIIRRMSNDFRREEGVIQETSEAYAKRPDSQLRRRSSKMPSLFRWLKRHMNSFK